MAERKRGYVAHIRFSIRLDSHTLGTIEERAHAQRRSINEQIAYYLDKAIMQEDAELERQGRAPDLLWYKAEMARRREAARQTADAQQY